MTKIKNTKKGMAKKTLSISLVAAMLATSNVPVWATEFGDGSDDTVVEFSSGDVAPAAEVVSDAPVVETEEAPMSKTVVESGDLLTDVEVTKEVEFGDTVEVKGTINYKNDNESYETLKDFEYAWRIAGEKNVAISTGKVTAGNDISGMSFTADFANGKDDVDWSKYVGQTLELYIFKTDDKTDATNIKPTVIGTTVLKKKDISKLSLKLETDHAYYNGKEFVVGTTDFIENLKNEQQDEIKETKNNSIKVENIFVDTNGNGEIDTNETKYDLKYFDVSTTGTAKNAGDKMTITATAKADSPYAGTSKAKPFTVRAKKYKAGDLVVKATPGQSYEYTGLAMPVSGVTLTESEDLSGADLTKIAVPTAVTIGSSNPKLDAEAVGTHNYKVTFNEAALTNFADLPDYIESVGEDATQQITITKRDLSKVQFSVKYGRVPVGTKKADFCKYLLQFNGKTVAYKDAENNDAFNFKYDEGTDYTVKIINLENNREVDEFDTVNSYEIRITAIKAEGTFVNEQTFKVEAASNVIQGASFANVVSTAYAPYYTGSEIKPTQEELGDLVIKGGNLKDETIQKENWTITGYENNVNAGSASVIVKIGGTSSYAGQTVKVPFTIGKLTVSQETVTVPKTITYNKGYSNAADYKVPLVVKAKDPTGKIVKELAESDYTVKYEFDGEYDVETESYNKKGNHIKATITITNSNYAGTLTIVMGQPPAAGKTAKDYWTEITAKAVSGDMIKFTPDTYTYTGGNIIPEFYVADGAFVLYDGEEGDKTSEYQVVSVSNNLNVGTGKVTIKGINKNYSGTASAEFKIVPADTSSVKIEIDDQKYTGKTIRPRTFKATLNGNNVTDQFEIVSFGENVEGKGTVVLKAVDGNKNFTGGNITAEFNIYNEVVNGEISVYNSNGINITADYCFGQLSDYANKTAYETAANSAKYFEFDGTEKVFATERLNNLVQIVDGKTAETKAKPEDFEIKYAENVTGIAGGGVKTNNNPYDTADKKDCNVAYVYAVAKEGSGYTGNKTITLADGTTIKNVVAVKCFKIANVEFNKQNIAVKSGTYAGGLPVKPDVLVQVKGNTLVEGKDYTLEFYEGTIDSFYYNFLDETKAKFVSNCTEVTDGKVYGVKVIGKGGYAGSVVAINECWGIDKKNLKDCDVTVKDGVATVKNGYIPVADTEYTSVNNGDGTYTVTAKTTSKNYTGSVTVDATGKAEDEKPDAPMIQEVKVVGNNATVILSGESEGAAGYDYVISTDRNCITTKDYDKVNKNVLNTDTNFTYAQQGVYYAYCHAWKRGEDGKKVFSDWSNAYPFVVSAVTPDQPGITSVKVSGSTVTVTYTKAANADGYDVVLGTAVKKVAGESRPVEYGKLVKKNIKGNVVTATFKNVKKGTYYAGLHAYNRTSEDGKKVFSPWSNTKKVTVK